MGDRQWKWEDFAHLLPASVVMKIAATVPPKCGAVQDGLETHIQWCFAFSVKSSVRRVFLLQRTGFVA